MTDIDPFSIRLATRRDAAPIASIYSKAILARNATMVLDPVSASEMEGKFSSLGPKESILVISESNDIICGWGIVKMYSDRPGYRLTCETSLFIDAAYRRRGLGKRLQLALMSQAQQSGFHHIIVRIWAANQGSIDLHKQVGFTMVGIQNEIGHVDHKWIDVAVMQCLLPL